MPPKRGVHDMSTSHLNIEVDQKSSEELSNKSNLHIHVENL